MFSKTRANGFQNLCAFASLRLCVKNFPHEPDSNCGKIPFGRPFPILEGGVFFGGRSFPLRKLYSSLAEGRFRFWKACFSLEESRFQFWRACSSLEEARIQFWRVCSSLADGCFQNRNGLFPRLEVIAQIETGFFFGRRSLLSLEWAFSSVGSRCPD